MLDNYVSITNAFVAGEATFFPNADPKKHKCLLTVIKNRGKNKFTGEEMKDEIGLVFWGGYAQSAALYLDKGRAINVYGTLRSHTQPTGQVKANGKAELHRNMSVNVSRFEFGPETKKELVKRIAGNLALIQAAKDKGTRSPDQPITAEELIAVNRPAKYDYNPELAMKTGRYGNARVYIKGQGFLGEGPAAPIAVPDDDHLARLEAEVTRLKAAKKAATAGAGEIVDPFPQEV